MADGCHFEKKTWNRHNSATVRPLATKFGTITHAIPMNFTMPAHTLRLLFYLIKLAKTILNKAVAYFACAVHSHPPFPADNAFFMGKKRKPLPGYTRCGLSQTCRRRTEPWTQVTCIKIGKDLACDSGISWRTDRQTDPQTDILITVLRNCSRVQFLLVVKAIAFKGALSKVYPQILSTKATFW